MAKRLRRSLVALSASAVAAIYAAGYIRTQLADAELAAAERPPSVIATVSLVAQPTITLPFPDERRSPDDDYDDLGLRRRPAATPTPTPRMYKDGAYQGVARSTRGNVEVTVTIQDGRIVRVSLDTVTTQYPVRTIAALPAQVKARQSAEVDMISGATISVNAFIAAVEQALSQAL